MIDRRRFLSGAGMLGVVPLGLGGFATGVEPMLPAAVTRYALTPPGWPADLPLRIVAIADIHACEPWMPAERVREIALAANALRPDLILLLGDFNAGHRYVTAPVMPAAWADALSPLAAPLGIYAVLGNHDWWHGPVPGMPGGPEEVRQALAGIGVRVLENDAVPLRQNGRLVWLAGLADQLAHRLAPQRTRGADDLAGTLARVGDTAPVILAMHEPFLFARMPDRVSLTLCGHTHGGQVRLPLIGTPFAPSQRYVYGHIVERERHLVISGGLGASGAPIRFGVPPEIVVVDLGPPPATG